MNQYFFQKKLNIHKLNDLIRHLIKLKTLQWLPSNYKHFLNSNQQTLHRCIFRGLQLIHDLLSLKNILPVRKTKIAILIIILKDIFIQYDFCFWNKYFWNWNSKTPVNIFLGCIIVFSLKRLTYNSGLRDGSLKSKVLNMSYLTLHALSQPPYQALSLSTCHELHAPATQDW